MVDSNLWFAGKDINYLVGKDTQSYKVLYPPIPVSFLDHSKTIVDEFNTQSVIALRDPIPVNLRVSFTDLKKYMDRFNLREIPEGIAVFSRGIMKDLRLPDDTITIEPDVVFTFNTVEWRITQVYPDSFIGNNDNVFLHYTCVICRNSRGSYVEQDQDFYNDYNLYFNSGTDLTTMNLLRSDLVIKNDSELVFNIGSNQQIYLLYNAKFGDIKSIIKTYDNIDIINDFIKTTIDIDGVIFNKYMADATPYKYVTLKLKVSLNPHYK